MAARITHADLEIRSNSVVHHDRHGSPLGWSPGCPTGRLELTIEGDAEDLYRIWEAIVGAGAHHSGDPFGPRPALPEGPKSLPSSEPEIFDGELEE